MSTNSTINVRFAPSPTGMLHVGNVRTALITWLFARKHGGNYLLRVDDTDTERSKKEYEDAMRESLTWLGIDWDREAWQSKRLAEYAVKIEQLKIDGRLYACYETPEELSLKRKATLSRGKPPVYDRASLSLSDAQKKIYESEGRKPHWRFKLNPTPIIWHDLVRGDVKFDGADLSDPVLIREDGTPLYHLCSVIDDIDFEITHVVRGEDHVSNTALHIQMFEALGAKPPLFAHLPLLSDPEGGKLSKRLGSMSIIDLRDDEGLEPMAIPSLLARLGTSDPIEPCLSLQPLIDTFDFAKFSRGTPKFDTDELDRLNSKIIHQISYDAVKDRLNTLGISKLDENFWNAVRANLSRFRDIKIWWDVAKGSVPMVANDHEFVAGTVDLLPPEPWNNTTWKVWTDAIKEKTGRKGKELFMPLRLALTGLDHGPELADLLPLIGSNEAKARLNKRA
jgi:glutamyl-tRNA synthetase